GMTPVEYINQQRLALASQLLRTTSRSLEDISMECGFNNLTNFNKNFKQFKKMIPSDYKLYLKNKDRNVRISATAG
ncbi:MAG: AraC family transcriptional regulator, partial [Chitinophagaceae bacterium]